MIQKYSAGSKTRTTTKSLSMTQLKVLRRGDVHTCGHCGKKETNPRKKEVKKNPSKAFLVYIFIKIVSRLLAHGLYICIFVTTTSPLPFLTR